MDRPRPDLGISFGHPSAGRSLHQLEPVEPGGEGTGDRRMYCQELSRSGRRPLLTKSRYSSSASTTRGSPVNEQEEADETSGPPAEFRTLNCHGLPTGLRVKTADLPRSPCRSKQKPE